MKDFLQVFIRGLLIGCALLLAYLINRYVNRDTGILAAFSIGVIVCWTIIYLSTKRWL